MIINKQYKKFRGKTSWQYLIPFGDLHIGNRGCDLEKIKKQIKWIEDKDDCVWMGMGDYCDCINVMDKRFDAGAITKRYLDNRYIDQMIQMQVDDFIDLFEPIADKCIGLHRGNHEETIRLRYHFNVMYELEKRWKQVPMLEDVAYTRLVYERSGCKDRHRFDIYSTHGRAGGRKGGNKINWLEDFIGYAEADVYLMAHSHIKEAEIKTQLKLDNTCRLVQSKKVLAVTGCFLRGYQEGASGYVEKWMYPPTDLGVVKVMFQPYTHDIHVSM